MKKTTIILLVLTLLVGCDRLDIKRLQGVVAECNGESLLATEIEALTLGLSVEDSAQVAEQYVHQWAINLLMKDVIRGNQNKEIERLVAEYRRSLYQHEWEQHLVARKMSQHVEDSVVLAYYETNKHHFVLRETILRGVLLVVPNGAPSMDQLKRYIVEPQNEEHIEWVEKYAYQYASGYELFLDEWKTANQILLRMPFEEDNLRKQLKQQRQITMQDSLNNYILQVVDVYVKGEQMPIDYARKEIEKIILSQRQVDFIESERENLYNNAIQSGKLKRYEK